MTLKDNTDKAIRDIQRGAAMRETLRRAGGQVADAAIARAPKATGAGAKSIHTAIVVVAGVPEARVSWDRDHFYMSFREFGTKYQQAEPFLRPAAEQFR